MTEGFAADADRIDARSQDFAEHAQRARKVAESMQNAIGDGSPWGDDAVGQSFAAAHAEPAARALELLGGIGGDLDAIGGKFVGAAESYRGMDQGAVDDLGDLGAAGDPEEA